MATTVSKAVDVDAPPAAVMGVLADLERLPDWSDVHKEVEILDRDDAGRPRRARMKVSVMNFSDEQVLAYEWRDDGVRWTLEEGSQQKDQIGSYEVSAKGGGSRVRYELSVTTKVPAPGFVVKQSLKKVADSATKRLGDAVRDAR